MCATSDSWSDSFDPLAQRTQPTRPATNSAANNSHTQWGSLVSTDLTGGIPDPPSPGAGICPSPDVSICFSPGADNCPSPDVGVTFTVVTRGIASGMATLKGAWSSRDTSI